MESISRYTVTHSQHRNMWTTLALWFEWMYWLGGTTAHSSFSFQTNFIFGSNENIIFSTLSRLINITHHHNTCICVCIFTELIYVCVWWHDIHSARVWTFMWSFSEFYYVLRILDRNIAFRCESNDERSKENIRFSFLSSMTESIQMYHTQRLRLRLRLLLMLRSRSICDWIVSESSVLRLNTSRKARGMCMQHDPSVVVIVFFFMLWAIRVLMRFSEEKKEIDKNTCALRSM